MPDHEHNKPDLRQWEKHLEALVSQADPAILHPEKMGAEEIRNFRDDRGHRRAVDVPFLTFRGGGKAADRPGDATPDELLWWALHDETVDVDRILAENRPQPVDKSQLHHLRGGEGGLFAQGLFRTIEVWTEADLAGLHALWHLARKQKRKDWQEKVLKTAAWHVEEVQPDNGTNHPWALHVFLFLAREGDSPGALLHAETLLNNSLITLGRPDRFSAHILADCAACLRELH